MPSPPPYSPPQPQTLNALESDLEESSDGGSVAVAAGGAVAALAVLFGVGVAVFVKRKPIMDKLKSKRVVTSKEDVGLNTAPNIAMLGKTPKV